MLRCKGFAAAFALMLGIALLSPPAGGADIVFSTGGYALGGSIYAMNDDGTNVRLLVPGSYEKPFVAADGTVLFTPAYSLLFPSGNVYGYKNGVVNTLASDFSGAADGVESGYNGIFAFKNVLQYNLDTMRRGQLGSAATTALTLCKAHTPFGPDPDHFNRPGYWEATSDEPQAPAISPVRDELVFTGCTWRRHWTDETIAIENIPALSLVTPADGEQVILTGHDSWSFDDPSYSPDGNSLVFAYWRGYDSKGLQREAFEGIWTSASDGTGPRQILTLHTGELAQRQNVLSPRFTGDGRVVFGFTDWIDRSRDGLYAVPADCQSCTMANATLLDAGGTYPAWTPLHIAAPSPAAPAAPAAPAPPTQPAPASPGPSPSVDDHIPPSVTTFNLAPARFKAAVKGTSVGAGTKTGTAVSYRLSEPARLTFTVTQLLPGRLEHGKCAAPSQRNRRGRVCTRKITLRGTFTHVGRRGANAFRFTGRLGGRKLAPGNYLLSATALDAAGNRSRPLQRQFTITR